MCVCVCVCARSFEHLALNSVPSLFWRLSYGNTFNNILIFPDSKGSRSAESLFLISILHRSGFRSRFYRSLRVWPEAVYLIGTCFLFYKMRIILLTARADWEASVARDMCKVVAYFWTSLNWVTPLLSPEFCLFVTFPLDYFWLLPQFFPLQPTGHPLSIFWTF